MRRLWRPALIGLGLLLAALVVQRVFSDADFACSRGEKVAASLGDGVILHSCSSETTPGHFVRSGPLVLIRNGILILQLQTDVEGRLQGEYRAWDDDGLLTESGHYLDGQKHGEWRSIDAGGSIRVTVYRAGIPVDP